MTVLGTSENFSYDTISASQLLKAMFEQPGHSRELWNLVRGAKHVRESESDLEIAPTRPKLEKMRKSRKIKEIEKNDEFLYLKY